jgi:riboflavin synthase
MFTGLITDVGEVAARDGGRFQIRAHYPAADIAVGASIACNGVCLTATRIEPAGDGSLFTVDVSNETLSKTTLGTWEVGTPVNLERSMRRTIWACILRPRDPLPSTARRLPSTKSRATPSA